MKNTLKKITPAPLWRAAGSTWDAIKRTRTGIGASLHPWRRDTVQRLGALKDIHKGERCFILGNGPSLKVTDLNLLRNEYTIGLNRIYLAFPEIGFETTYFVTVNDLVVEQCAEDIQKLPMKKFVAWRARKWLTLADDLYFLHTSYTGPGFETDIRKRLWEGATVTNIALQLAYFLGFQQVILIGVDHNYATKGTPNTTIVSDGDDPNHFAPNYFGKGFRWQLPDLETSERGYRMARAAYEADNRQVVDATIGGKLRIFPRVAYESLFETGNG